MIERDNAESLRSQFDTEVKSGEFVFKHTLSINGITSEYQNKYHNDVRNQGKGNIDLTHIFR